MPIEELSEGLTSVTIPLNTVPRSHEVILRLSSGARFDIIAAKLANTDIPTRLLDVSAASVT